MKKQLEIFKPGTHTTMAGRVITFGESNLVATIAAYDPAKHEAPLVIGHPTADAPAYGWVKALSFAEGALLAESDQVDAAFAEMVNAGKFKKVSASFYLPDAPNNPVPGVYYLRHVGFLGAQAPSVKGLKSASFSEVEEGIVEFGDWADRVEAGLFRKLREWIIGKFGVEEADKALPGWDVDTVQTEAAQPEECESQSGISPEFSEKETTSMLTQEQIAAKETEFTLREARLKKQEDEQLRSGHASFAEGLVNEGKLLPVQKETVVALLSFTGGLPVTAEFAEGKTQEQLFKEFLSSQPKIVEFGEHAGHEDETTTSVSFAAPPGYTVDAAGLETHNRALAYQAKNPGIDYMTAVKAVQ